MDNDGDDVNSDNDEKDGLVNMKIDLDGGGGVDSSAGLVAGRMLSIMLRRTVSAISSLLNPANNMASPTCICGIAD